MPSNYVCPVCGRPMMSANELCSGGFLDTDHPSNVEPQRRRPSVSSDCERCGGSGFYKVDQGDGYFEEYNCPCTEGSCDAD